ncbi:MAG TPA: MarR family transcriptional regulator [Phycisphaerae bacterium]|nr:MarR family transcriptional regulator [Phycisphaerae bacterium]
MDATTKKRRHDDTRAGAEDGGSRCDFRILNAVRQIIRAADIDSRKLAADHQVTAPQLMCLLAVVEKGSATATDIAERIHLSPSTLVGVLDRLEGKGLIRRVRDVEDRRRVEVTVSDAGRVLASETPFPLQYSLDKALKQLSDRQRQRLATSMERLAELMGARETEPAPMLEIIAVHKRQRRIARGTR